MFPDVEVGHFVMQFVHIISCLDIDLARVFNKHVTTLFHFASSCAHLCVQIHHVFLESPVNI